MPASLRRELWSACLELQSGPGEKERQLRDGESGEQRYGVHR